MKLFSIFALLLLTACETVDKHEDNIRRIAYDFVDEEIDHVVDQSRKEASKIGKK